MSVNLSKGPIWAVAVILGLIAATALVAGYVDRPGSGTQVAAAKADGGGCPAKTDCAACPAKGTDACCKEAGACAACPESCPKECCCADAAASWAAGATCPMKAAAATGNCSGGQCPAAQ